MPEMDGLTVVRSLRGEIRPLIIFVTAYEKHALEAFEVDAVDYLLKPVRRERLERAIAKAARQLKSAKPAEVDEHRTKNRGTPRVEFVLAGPGRDHRVSGRRRAGAHHHRGAKVFKRSFAARARNETTEAGIPPQCIAARSSIPITSSRISPLSSKRWLLKMSNGFEAIVSKRLASSIRGQTKW